MRVSKNVDFTSEEFSSQLSGIAVRFKTMALEHKAIIAEQKMRSALQYQFKVMCSAWSKLGICNKEDYLKVFFEFKRNLPDNLKEEAETQQLLKGYVSENTRLGLFSKVDDVEYELEQMKMDGDAFGGTLSEVTE